MDVETSVGINFPVYHLSTTCAAYTDIISTADKLHKINE